MNSRKGKSLIKIWLTEAELNSLKLIFNGNKNILQHQCMHTVADYIYEANERGDIIW